MLTQQRSNGRRITTKWQETAAATTLDKAIDNNDGDHLRMTTTTTIQNHSPGGSCCAAFTKVQMRVRTVFRIQEHLLLT